MQGKAIKDDEVRLKKLVSEHYTTFYTLSMTKWAFEFQPNYVIRIQLKG